MTVANRAIGSPINIWNDHSDTMSQRDSGWIQLYAETNQEALDLHVQAYKLAEAVSLPVMVCMDGFILTHAYERVDLPGREEVDAFLPSYEPRQVLDPSDPVTIGALVGPEAFFEVKYLMHAKQMQALDLIPELAADFEEAFGRDSGGLLSSYRMEDADTVIVALGSVLGTIKDVIDEPASRGRRSASWGSRPSGHSRATTCGDARRGRTRRRAGEGLAIGVGGIVGQNIRLSLEGLPVKVYDVIAGLGGRPIMKKSLRPLFAQALADELDSLTFLDLDRERVARELERQQAGGRPGPHAESMVKELGIVASRPH